METEHAKEEKSAEPHFLGLQKEQQEHEDISTIGLTDLFEYVRNQETNKNMFVEARVKVHQLKMKAELFSAEKRLAEDSASRARDAIELEKRKRLNAEEQLAKLKVAHFELENKMAALKHQNAELLKLLENVRTVIFPSAYE